MEAYGLLIFFLLISVIFSFLCSIWEAVLLSITPTFAEGELQKGSTTGLLIKDFKDNIDRPLAAILTLNTIAHTVGAMGVGAQAEQIWTDDMGIPVNLGFTSFEIGAGVIVATVVTLVILIFSEIVPKTLGANYWKQLSGFTVKSLNIVIKLLYPLVWVSQKITKVLKKDKSKSVFNKTDFATMAALADKEGVFKQSESKIIQNLLHFETIRAKDIMTPRTVVKAAPEGITLKEFYEENKKLRFSRIPLYTEFKDNINGFILKDELLSNLLNGNGDLPLKDIKREIHIVNDSTILFTLFNQMMEKRAHIALVVDEFGGMSGLVTMEDIIETLLGMEIVDEYDGTDDMQVLARKNWEKRAKELGLLEAFDNEDEK